MFSSKKNKDIREHAKIIDYRLNKLSDRETHIGMRPVSSKKL